MREIQIIILENITEISFPSMTQSNAYIIRFIFLVIFHIIAGVCNRFETPFSELFIPDCILLNKFLNDQFGMQEIEQFV